mmetsp:Transcript_17222/g.53537  ORF Transcript_17222/g.53537 Transcript_17222/m.53537 type:complete len:205 (-) Transcript_17222:261-875(-)
MGPLQRLSRIAASAREHGHGRAAAASRATNACLRPASRLLPRPHLRRVSTSGVDSSREPVRCVVGVDVPAVCASQIDPALDWSASTVRLACCGWQPRSVVRNALTARRRPRARGKAREVARRAVHWPCRTTRASIQPPRRPLRCRPRRGRAPAPAQSCPSKAGCAQSSRGWPSCSRRRRAAASAGRRAFRQYKTRQTCLRVRAG